MAAAVLVVGVVIAVLLAVSFVKDVVGVSRFTTARPAEKELMAGDESVIYASRHVGSGSSRPEPGCQVTDVAGGQPVAIRPHGSFTLTLGDDEFSSVARFEVPRDGRYRISCTADTSAPVEMAVGPRIRVFRSIGVLVASGGVGIVALALAVLIVVLTAVKRHEARRR